LKEVLPAGQHIGSTALLGDLIVNALVLRLLL